MKHAIEKLSKKNKPNKSLILNEQELSEQKKAKIEKRLTLKRSADDRDILSKNSTSV